MAEWRDNLNRDKCRQKQWNRKESVEKQECECRFLSRPFNTHKKCVLIYDLAAPDHGSEHSKQIRSQRVCVVLCACSDLAGNKSNLFLTRAESVICDEGVLDQTPVWFPDIQTAVKPQSCGAKLWKMDIIHVFSALNNNIKTTSDEWKDIPLSLLAALSVLFAATISEH